MVKEKSEKNEAARECYEGLIREGLEVRQEIPPLILRVKCWDDDLVYLRREKDLPTGKNPFIVTLTWAAFSDMFGSYVDLLPGTERTIRWREISKKIEEKQKAKAKAYENANRIYNQNGGETNDEAEAYYKAAEDLTIEIRDLKQERYSLTEKEDL